MGALDTGIITPARPLIAKDLGVDDSAGIWMITVYTLAYAAAIPVVGKLADRRGRKPVFLVSIAVFGIGSLLCGLAQDFASFPLLIAARALQAVGGGGILPIATAQISSEAPPEKRGMALGLVGAVFGVANIFGASVGSLILDVAGPENWQWIFYVNLPIAVGIVAAGWFLLPNETPGESKPMDLIGTLLLVGIILSLLYGIKNLDFFELAISLRSPTVWPLLVGCLAALPLLVLAERRAPDPVLNLRYFTDRGIRLTLALSVLSGAVLMAVVFVPQLAENALRMPEGTGGYFVIVLGLASGIGAPLSGRLTDRFGPRLVLGFGFGVSTLASAAVVWWMIPHPSTFSVITCLALIGLGLGFVVGSPLNYMMLQRTDPTEASSALGTLSLVRSIGTTLAPAIMVGFVVQGAAGLQDALIAELPTTVQVPALPHARELEQRFADWKADERFKDSLAGVELPDLDRSEVTVDLSGGDGLPDDLVELLKTADVTNITERTAIVAKRMFEANTPETIQSIQSGVDAGLDSVRKAVEATGESRQEMSNGLDELDGKLAEISTGLKKMDGSLAEMSTGIKKMDGSLAQMTTGIKKMDGSLAQMTTGIKKMGKGVDGLDTAIDSVMKPLAALDDAIAGMDAGLEQQRAALAELRALPEPPLDQIEALQASIAQTESEREAAARQRAELRTELDSLTAQRAKLAKERDKLAAARKELATQRSRLATARNELTEQRAKLADGRQALRTQRDKLAKGKTEVTKAREELAAARKELDAVHAELEDTVARLSELRDAVPGAFDRALQGYLADIDARGPRLEAAFSTAVGDGYRGVYLFNLSVCLLALVLLAFVPRPATATADEGKAARGTNPADSEIAPATAGTG
jgi:EmrB/QacA subfamily drug resistance transporter